MLLGHCSCMQSTSIFSTENLRVAIDDRMDATRTRKYATKPVATMFEACEVGTRS